MNGERLDQRKFDHEEARRLYVEGWTALRLATYYGVHPQTIYRALGQDERRPKRERVKSRPNRERVPVGFVVFTPNGDGLREVGRTDAVTRQAAIEAVATEEGDYVAIRAAEVTPLRVGQVTRLAVIAREDEPL